ncbi:MAG: DUF1295 domain-containing protein [Patescibacteria group bacterium]
MSFLIVFSLAAFVVSVLYYCVFALAIARRRNDVADIAWPMGFVLVSLISLFLTMNISIRYLMLMLLLTIWSARLGVHIFLRNKSKGEDWRYRNWRKKWGKWWEIKAYLNVFLLQSCLLMIISVPIIWTAAYAWKPLGLVDYLGVSIWFLGFLFESIADYQLFQFKKKASNKNKVLKTGLWRYSRHPNYFGELLVWWGVFMIALSAKDGLISIVGPLTITYLLTSVSGIPMLEKRYEGNAGYKKYQETTSSLIPLPPKL